MDAEGAGGISTPKNGGHSQVRGKAASPGIAQGALLGDLRSQVGAYAGGVGVDEDADPDHRASLVMRGGSFQARVASTSLFIPMISFSV